MCTQHSKNRTTKKKKKKKKKKKQKKKTINLQTVAAQKLGWDKWLSQQTIFFCRAEYHKCQGLHLGPTELPCCQKTKCRGAAEWRVKRKMTHGVCGGTTAQLLWWFALPKLVETFCQLPTVEQKTKSESWVKSQKWKMPCWSWSGWNHVGFYCFCCFSAFFHSLSLMMRQSVNTLPCPMQL